MCSRSNDHMEEVGKVVTSSGLNCTLKAVNSTNGDGWLFDKRARTQSHLNAILEDHANSATNALMYIGIVLLIYVVACCVIGFRYFLTRSHRKLLFTPYYFTKSSKTETTTTPETATTSRGAATSTGRSGLGGSSRHTQETEAFAFSEELIETEL